MQAARDPLRGPVLVFGEPGLFKDNFAALVHFGSKSRGGPLVQASGGEIAAGVVSGGREGRACVSRGARARAEGARCASAEAAPAHM